MKTTQGDINTAYIALNRIRSKVRGKDGLALFHLKNQLQENIDYITEEEVSLVKEYGGTISPNGMIVIPDKDKRTEFGKAHSNLFEMEVEIKPDIPTISLERNPDITMEDIEQLDGFVEFE